jgi:putative transposase
MCRVLGVSRQGYSHYRRNTEARLADPEYQEMLEWVKDIAIASHYTYGRRRIKKAMNVLGFPITRTMTESLMEEAEARVRHKKKFKVTTNSDHKLPLFENLLEREFDVEQPNQVIASDITYVWTQEGWLYLAVVIDLYSRKVVGWSMSSRMTAQLVCDALMMAIWLRRPKAGLIHHSDRGSQYASRAFRKLLKTHGFKGSMSRNGDCWDNAVVESFFGSLKQERVHWRHYQTRYEAQQDILDYISMFYNSYRLHSYLDYRSPNQYEMEMTELRKVA